MRNGYEQRDCSGYAHSRADLGIRSERTAWAEGMGLGDALVDALTLIAEESARRLGDARPELPPGDVRSEWPQRLEAAGQQDLADHVRALWGD